MAIKPSRLTNLQHPDAVNVINKSFSDLANQVNSLTQAVNGKRIFSSSVLHFGTVNAHSSKDATVNILGASTTLVAHANPILPLESTGQLTWTSFVLKNGQVTVRVSNPTTGNLATNDVHWNILVS